jgi:hypothetical protein
MDRLREGAAGRCLLYCLGYLLSAYFGWQLLMNGSAGLGIVCLLGIPPVVIAWLAEASRRSKIRETALGNQASEQLSIEQQQIGSFDARRAGESVAEWVERTLASNSDLERRVVEGYAAHHPPEVGTPLIEWVRSWPEWNPAWDPAIVAKADTFREDDTIVSWAARTSRRLGQLGLCDEDEMRAQLIALAEHAKPRIGETLSDYSERANTRLRRLRNELDGSSTASAASSRES